MIGVGKRTRKQKHISGFFGLLEPHRFFFPTQTAHTQFSPARVAEKCVSSITLSQARDQLFGHEGGSVLAGNHWKRR